MSLISIEGDDSLLLESQNFPRCIHSEEISKCISNAIKGHQFNFEKLTNLVIKVKIKIKIIEIKLN